MARHFPPKRKTTIDVAKKRRGYDEGGEVKSTTRGPSPPPTQMQRGSKETGVYAPRQESTVGDDRMPNMTRPDPGWAPKMLPNAQPFSGFGQRPWMGQPMAKGGKVKKVTPVVKKRR